VGGRAADLFRPLPTLASALFVAAVACGAIGFVNTSMAMALDNWGGAPRRIAVHTLAVLAPVFVALGMTAPLVTRVAMAAGHSAWRAAGSIWATLTAGALA